MHYISHQLNRMVIMVSNLSLITENTRHVTKVAPVVIYCSRCFPRRTTPSATAKCHRKCQTEKKFHFQGVQWVWYTTTDPVWPFQGPGPTLQAKTTCNLRWSRRRSASLLLCRIFFSNQVGSRSFHLFDIWFQWAQEIGRKLLDYDLYCFDFYKTSLIKKNG